MFRVDRGQLGSDVVSDEPLSPEESSVLPFEVIAVDLVRWGIVFRAGEVAQTREEKEIDPC